MPYLRSGAAVSLEKAQADWVVAQAELFTCRAWALAELGGLNDELARLDVERFR